MTAAGEGGGGGGGFRKVGERLIHDGYVIRLLEGSYVDPSGRAMRRDVVRHPGAVGVVPVDGAEVVLVRQYRAAVEAEVLEIPAGLRDVAGEAPEVTAMREMEEEIGFTCDSVAGLGAFHNSVGFSDELVHLFLATGLRAVPHRRSGAEEEWMTVVRAPVGEVAQMIERGEITDAKTVVGLLLAARRLGW